MKLIVISHPGQIDNEAGHVHKLFDHGLEVFHLRKNLLAKEEFEETLKQFKPVFYKRMVIHTHYKLVEKYNLKGIHLTGWFMEQADKTDIELLIRTARKRRLTVSGSFHTIEAVDRLSLKLDYVFLSPVFDSISKEGYKSRIDLDEVAFYLQNKTRAVEVIALGGIDESNVQKVKAAGFDGAALLGAVWNSQHPEMKFESIKNSVAA